MQELIALSAPALMAVGFYNHLYRSNLSTRKLFFFYGTMLVLINGLSHLTILYLIGKDEVAYTGKSFIFYLILSSVFAVIMPFVVNLIEHTVALEVKQNAKK